MKRGRLHNKSVLETRWRLTIERQRLAIYIVTGLVLATAMVAALWFWVVAADNKARYETRLAQLMAEKQEQVSRYQATTLEELARYATEETTRTLLLNKDAPNGMGILQQRIQAAIRHANVARFYYPGEAQEEKNTGGAIGFVVLDMINRLERGQRVYPEAAKLKSSAAWQIHWLVPVYQSNPDISSVAEGDKALLAILYLATSTAGLQHSLALDDSGLGRLQVAQKIGAQNPLTFVSIGSADTGNTRVVAVPDSHWQLAFTPSKDFVEQVVVVPLWFMVFALFAFSGMGALAFFLARRKNNAALVLPDSYSINRVTLDGSKKSAGGELSDPIYLAGAHLEIDVADEALVLGGGHRKQGDNDEGSVEEPSLAQESSAVVTSTVEVPAHIFRAYDIRGVVDRDLNPGMAEAIGKAIASEALDGGEKALIVGRDSRSHSPALCAALQKGILSTGCNVIDIGLVPTPLMNFATFFSDQTGSGVVVTASHNAKEYNGFKVAINEKTLVDADIQQLRERVQAAAFAVGKNPGRVIEAQFQEDYIDAIAADIAVNADMHLVIDAANGAASQLAPALFAELGCQVTPLFCDFDGDFPNHNPDPTIAANLQALIQQVQASKADLGIALDGDGDRLVVVTSTGKIIWPDQLLMLFARDVVSRNPGCDVIFDVKSTRQLNPLITSYGGRPVMWKTGHAHIKAKMRETGALLAGEFSGHIFFKERWFGFDDGLYAAARLLEIMSLRDQSLDKIMASVPDIFYTPEIKIAVPEERKYDIVEQLIVAGDFSSGEKTTIDGLRVDFAKGWGLVRASNTSPALTLRFEASNENGVEQLKNLFKRELSKIDNTLDLTF